MLAFAIQHFASRLSVFAGKALAGVVLLAVLSSCATTAVPVGDWSRLSDLDVSDRSLDHVRVAVECASFDRAGRLQQHKLRLCRTLKPWLQSLGADVVDASVSASVSAPTEGQHADFTLQYVDAGVVDRQSSAVSFAGALLTGFLLPYVTSAASESELRVLDSRGVEIDRQKLRIQEITIFGWGALYGMIVHRDRQDEHDLSVRFYQFAQNRLVSQVPGRDL